MEFAECMKTRRSIRKYKPDEVPHSLIESIVTSASYSPSWKNTQITRYIAIEDPVLRKTIADTCVPEHNGNIIRQAPVLMALTLIKGHSGFNPDGTCTTAKGDRWQMFDVGVSAQSFCLSAKEKGLGTVIMGIFDEEKIADLLSVPEDRELAVLIALGWPDEDPVMKKRVGVEELLTYR